MQNLIRLLIVTFLVMVPAAILITGNAAWLPVAQWSVVVYALLIAAVVLCYSRLQKRAAGWHGKDFGEGAHTDLMSAYGRLTKMSPLSYHFAAIQNGASVILFLALGKLLPAIILTICVCSLYLARGHVERYAKERGKSSGKPA